jgi:hypothetical protein
MGIFFYHVLLIRQIQKIGKNQRQYVPRICYSRKRWKNTVKNNDHAFFDEKTAPKTGRRLWRKRVKLNLVMHRLILASMVGMIGLGIVFSSFQQNNAELTKYVLNGCCHLLFLHTFH